MADPQPVDAPMGVDPSIVSAMQGGFGAPAMDPRAYGDAPSTTMDASMLPAPVSQAVQSGFAPPPPPGVVDGLGAPGAPQYAPPPFQPAPLADPFPPSPVVAPAVAAPSKADVAATKKELADQAAAQAADAKAQAKQAAYDATPQGMDEAATRQQLDVNKDQQADALAKGEIDSQAAVAAVPILDKGVADEQELLRKQAAAREADIAQLKQMVVNNGNAVEEAAKRTVDPNRMWNNMSTAQHIGIGIMTILAGAGQGLARDNGPNPVSKMISEAIDHDIDSQKGSIEQGNKAIEQRRQLAQDFGALSDKQSDQYEYMRAKGRLVVADALEAAAAHYGSPKAMMAAKIEADNKRQEAAKIVQGLSERKLAQQNKDAELANQRAQIGIAGFSAQTGRMELADREIARREAAKDKLDQIDEAAKMKAVEIAAKKGATPEGGVSVPTGQLVKNPDGTVMAKSAPLINGNGEPYVIPKSMEKDTYERFGASKSAIDAIDKLRILRSENGGDINKWSAEARTKLQEYTRAIVHQHKANGISGFKGPVVEMMEKEMTGSDDEDIPTSLTKGIMSNLDNAREDLLTDRRNALPNFDGDPRQLDVPDPLKNKPAESPWSQELRKLQAKAPELPVGGGISGKTNELMRKAQRINATMNGLSEDQRDFLQMASRQINVPERRDQTVQHLDEIVSKPEMPSAFRAAAQALLDTLNRPKVTKLED